MSVKESSKKENDLHPQFPCFHRLTKQFQKHQNKVEIEKDPNLQILAYSICMAALSINYSHPHLCYPNDEINLSSS